MMRSVQITRTDYRIAWLTALAITIHIAESALPSPLPGIKPGLANVVTITTLVLFGWRLAAWVTVLRVLAGSLLLGTFLSPTFMLSFAGATGTLVILRLASLVTIHKSPVFGPVGYSVLAALAHMACQFWVAYILFIPHPGLYHLLPVLMTAALIFGIFNGIIVLMIVRQVSEISSS